MMRTTNAVSLLLVSLAIACSGCGDSGTVGYVKGTATFDGAPMPAENLIFFEQVGKGLIAGGVVGENGAYSLQYKGSTGIPLGDYTVYVGPPATNMSEEEFRALKKKVDAEYRSRGEEPPPSPDWVMPAKYYLPGTSPLRQTVQAGENVIDLTLE